MSHESTYIQVKYKFVIKMLSEEYLIWNTNKMKRRSETAKVFLHLFAQCVPWTKMSLYFCHCERYDDEDLRLNSGLETHMQLNTYFSFILFPSCYILHSLFFFFHSTPFPTTSCNLSEVFIYSVYLSVEHSIVHTGRQNDMPRWIQREGRQRKHPELVFSLCF